MHKNDANCEICEDNQGVMPDESEGIHYGRCRGCGFYAHTLSNDDGYCGDCN